MRGPAHLSTASFDRERHCAPPAGLSNPDPPADPSFAPHPFAAGFEVDSRKPLNLPLPPATRLELARQLEALAARALGDNMLVADFFRGIARQWRDARCRDARRADARGVTPLENWPGLHAERPDAADAARWQVLFEYVSFKACLMLGAAEVLDFLDDLCDPARFDLARIDC